MVRLGRSDLQQGDYLAGGGQPVLDHRVMADLQRLLDAGTGVAQELDRSPGPERPLLGQVEVEKVPAGIPGGGAIAVRGADEHRIANAEGFAGLYGEKGLQAGPPVTVVVSSGLRERLQGRKAFTVR
ncbi:hypothetical protein ACFV8T_39960 [Streptomyces sp. NPDC059832]|uniref:hypothetical protein n=1 Tax=Streptomyces sp. NPDC059832 TaxID=3346966 RepID=UPI00364E7CD9